MSRRKGELSTAAIDREWPHQVALRDDFVSEHYEALRAFAAPLSVAPRSRSVTAVGPGHRVQRHVLFCFADWADAALFADEFGGEPFDPRKDRGRGARRDHWHRG